MKVFRNSQFAKLNIQQMAWDVKDNDGLNSFMDLFSVLGDPNTVQSQEFVRYLSEVSEPVCDQFLSHGGNSLGINSLNSTNGYKILRVDVLGNILEANKRAVDTYDIDPSKTLEENGIVSFDASGLSRQLSTIAKSFNTKNSFELIQVYVGASEHPSTVAIVPLLNEDAQQNEFLFVFLSSTEVSPVAQLIATKFKLTQSEQAVTECMLNGNSLREISQTRGRSYRTVRNQMQKILDKTGCNSQIMLLRLGNDLAQLVNNQRDATVPTQSDFYQRFEFPRPNGRKVEVVIAGDPNGTPFIAVADLLGHGISSKMIPELRKRKIRLISVARPGFGASSPAPKNIPPCACFQNDVAGLMKLLEIERCALTGKLTSAQSVFRLAHQMPDKFSKAIIVSGTLPRAFQRDITLTSRWTRSLIGAANASRPVLKLIILTAHRVFIESSDPGNFLKKNFRSPSDSLCLDDLYTSHMLQNSTRQITATYGADIGCQDIFDSLRPWGDELKELHVPVHLLHGTEDTNYPIQEVRELVKTNPEKLFCHTFENAGSLLYFSHLDAVLDKIAEV